MRSRVTSETDWLGLKETFCARLKHTDGDCTHSHTWTAVFYSDGWLPVCWVFSPYSTSHPLCSGGFILKRHVSYSFNVSVKLPSVISVKPLSATLQIYVVITFTMLSTFPVVIKLTVQMKRWIFADGNSEVFVITRKKQQKTFITSTRSCVFYWLFTDGRDGGDDLSELQFVQDRCFSSCVQTDWNKKKHQTLTTENSRFQSLIGFRFTAL